ncbi:hypothetical protein BDZ45DRAFT_735866 [Acephala macrosclerotiorum]|nr:hypothetical protein BDZ45DRAFT_735866 [Acephala macrosclerotiorum]
MFTDYILTNTSYPPIASIAEFIQGDIFTPSISDIPHIRLRSVLIDILHSIDSKVLDLTPHAAHPYFSPGKICWHMIIEDSNDLEMPDPLPIILSAYHLGPELGIAKIFIQISTDTKLDAHSREFYAIKA